MNRPFFKTARQKKWILAIVLATAALALGSWLFSNITWKETEVDLGYSREALQNNYLAAEFFLRKQGVQTTAIKNLTVLDTFSWRDHHLGYKDTLILVDAHKTIDQARYDKLMEWVENGGTLIASTSNPYIGDHTDAQDLLLESLRITLIEPEKKQDAGGALKKLADELEKIANPDDKEQSHSDPQTTATENNRDDKKTELKKDKKTSYAARCNVNQATTTIDVANEEKPLEFDVSHSQPFHYSAATTDEPGNEGSPVAAVHQQQPVSHMMYFAIGEGAITIISDSHIWQNHRIDCYDHAYGLWRLINPAGHVWFLVNQDAPSLWAIMWHTASYGVMASLLALGCWLWASAVRFGPLSTQQQTSRRSLAEHIYASAMLLWRRQEHPQLLQLLRNDIFARLQAQHAQVARAERAGQLAYLQNLTQLTPAAIEQALYADRLYHPQEFTSAIAYLQTIRKHL